MKAGAARKLDPPAPDPAGRTPESFLEEIQGILNSGTLRGAREVAEQGLVLFPGHPELSRMHHALRPYERARVVPGYNVGDPRPSFEWIKKNWREFRGQWVGLDNGELVASGSFDEVRKALRGRDPRNTLLHFIEQ
jgi:hypothetical protein